MAVQPQELSRLDVARKKFELVEQVNILITEGHLSQEELVELPSSIPAKPEELTAFMQQLFQQGIKKSLPGCPVRVNSNVLSVRLDGLQHRKAQEIRKLSDKASMKSYIQGRNPELHAIMDGNSIQHVRSNGHTELVTEEGREFYHIRYKSDSVSRRDMTTIYKSFVTQGRSDALLATRYDEIITIVKERNEERRREFVINRTNLNAEYIRHVVDALTIPIEAFQNQELVAALREAGLTAFIKKPKIDELVTTSIMVDVYSAPDESDESWRIMPVTPLIVESTEERTYHGQGTITSFDPSSSASKNGQLPFVIQHCLRVGAEINDFLSVLPEEFRANLVKSNEIYERIIGSSSESLNKEQVLANYATQKARIEQEAAREAILSAPVADLHRPAQDNQATGDSVAVAVAHQAELDRLIREAFAGTTPVEQAVEVAQVSVVQSLTESLLAQLQGAPTQTPSDDSDDDEDYDDGDDDLPFDVEPAVEVTPIPEITGTVVTPERVASPEPELQSLSALLAAMGMSEQQAPAHVESLYHESYGENPIFVRLGETDIAEYIAFRGQESQAFDSFNMAAIYTNKPINERVIMHNIDNRLEAINPDSTVWVMTFDGRLI